MRNPRHIAIFLPSLRGGGAERVMVTLANGFAKRGHRVDLVLVQAEGPYLPEVCSAVRIVDLNKGRVLTSLMPLARYLRRERPHVLLSTLRHANAVAAMAHRLASSTARLVLREANHVSRSDFSGLTGRINLRLYRWAYRSADVIVGISEGVSEAVRELAQVNNTRTIYNPINIERIVELSKKDDALTDKYKNRHFILGVGRLTKQKDFATLLKAFSKVHPFADVDLVILGEGGLRSELEELTSRLGISERVFMPGFVANPYAWMRAAEVFVLSSAWEGFGNVLIEALACGTPVISTDCPSGPREILEDGKWGRLVPVGDVEALAEALIASIGTSDLPDTQRRVENFRADHIVEMYLAVCSAS